MNAELNIRLPLSGMPMHKFLILTLAVTITFDIHAQDRHFSQFFNSPIQLNPALAGVIDGTYRVNLNYRDQWNKLTNGNYSTVNASGDINFKVPFRKLQQDLLGIGASFLSDKASTFGFQSNELAFVGAYHKSVGKNQFLSFGFKTGIQQRGINFENLKFEDQYIEGQGYVSTSRETLPENNVSFAELAIGLNYNWNANDEKSFNIGISWHHLNAPDFSYFNLSLPVNTLPVKKPLYRLFSFNVSGSFYNGSGVLTPRVWTLAQGPHFQAMAGASYLLPIDLDQTNKLILGGYLKGVKDEKGLALESFVPMIGIELGKVNFTFSYDANTRRLAQNYLNQSIFEFGLTFTGSQNNVANICPKF